MLSSNAYRRMRAVSPNEFKPKSIFFTYDEESRIDWRNSFRVKAALAYEAITGDHVNSHAMPIAWRLLLDSAKNFHSLILDPSKPIQHLEEPRPKTNEEIKKIEDEIRKFSEDTDQMKLVADGIFLVVGFLPRLKSETHKNKIRESVDDYFISTHTHDIITDIVKIENQLPLEHITNVVNHIENTMKQMNETSKLPENKRLASSLGKYKLNFPADDLYEIIHLFCWDYSPFHSKETKSHKNFKRKRLDPNTTLLDFPHFSLVQHISEEGEGASGHTWRMPIAKQLKRSLVRFEAKENGCAEIEERTLRMPALIYDFKLAAVAGNLLARECLHEEHRKPFTRYFQLMNELVVDTGDVKILKRAGVIRGGSRSGQDVLELLHKIDGYATYLSGS